MFVKDFDYDLPPELIANYPVAKRDCSRLMLLNRTTHAVSEDLFKNLNAYLKPGDLLVMNDTRVMPARLFGHKNSGGKVEIFLVKRDTGISERWSCLLRASKKIKDGQVILLEKGMTATVCNRQDAELWLIEFTGPESFDIWLEREGHIPLPPYLQRDDDQLDKERYQTVFSKSPGAVAAPTAGLHFTPELLAELEENGIKTAYLTLHTGLGTFQPVRVECVEDHRIHTERFSIPQATADAILSTRDRGGRVVAVGTTTTRTLEYSADNDGNVMAGDGDVDIFIYPGYKFRVVDALITNFHLPESTLLMLVSAFAGSNFIQESYREAIRRGFRFYSYGDAMLIV